MAETYTGENQPTDGAGAKFRGVRVDTGAAGEFISPAGDGVVTEQGKRVAAQRVNQPSTLGMGLAFGSQEDLEATTDDGIFSHMSLFKRLLIRFSDLITLVTDRLPSGANTAHDVADTGAPLKIGGFASSDIPADVDDDDRVNAWFSLSGELHTSDEDVRLVLGSIGDAAVLSDVDATMNGRMRGLVKWAFERMPGSLARKTANTSFPVVLSDEDLAKLEAIRALLATGSTAANQSSELTLVGAVTETAPATDTASSGLNGRLQRIAQRLTSILSVLPAALGAASIAASLPTTQAANTGLLATAVTVGTSATPLPASALANRRTLQYFNNGTVTTYVGGSAVTTSSGIPVGPGQSYSIDLGPSITLYAISGTAGQNGRVVEAA